jgi:uncharacterized protein (DUF427 family)
VLNLKQQLDSIPVEGVKIQPMIIDQFSTVVDKQYFTASQTHTVCPWKGEASYLNITVDGQANRDAAWTYPKPKDAAARIRGYIAFWRGVKVEA